MRRIKSHFPLSHGVPRVDDRKVVSGIIYVIRNGLRWRDAPGIYGPHKPCITGSYAGRRWFCLTKYSQYWLIYHRQPRCLATKATIVMLIARLWSSAALPRASRRGQNARTLQHTAKPYINSAARSKTCSLNSKTGGASQCTMTAAPMFFYLQSRSPL